MAKNKTYKQDSEGVLLMRKSFPKKIRNETLARLAFSRKLIASKAKKLFLKNKALWDKSGFSLEDIESIFMAQSYVLFNKINEDQNKVLSKFLKQRGSKMVGMYKKLAEGILETPVDLGEGSLEDLLQDTDTPEDILIAKEKTGEIFRVIKMLTANGDAYVQFFYEKNIGEMRFHQITREYLKNTAYKVAFNYAEKKYRNDLPMNMRDFKKDLIAEMSKLLKSLRKKVANG